MYMIIKNMDIKIFWPTSIKLFSLHFSDFNWHVCLHVYPCCPSRRIAKLQNPCGKFRDVLFWKQSFVAFHVKYNDMTLRQLLVLICYHFTGLGLDQWGYTWCTDIHVHTYIHVHVHVYIYSSRYLFRAGYLPVQLMSGSCSPRRLGLYLSTAPDSL